jgi:hypothetical protein
MAKCQGRIDPNQSWMEAAGYYSPCPSLGTLNPLPWWRIEDMVFG